MAKLIVYAYDIPGDESHKRGDVISIRDDGEPIGGDIENGVLQEDGSRRFLWRIVDVPGMAKEHEHLIDCGSGKDDVTKVFPMRTKRIDLDLVEGAASGLKGAALAWAKANGFTVDATLWSEVDARISLYEAGWASSLQADPTYLIKETY